MPKNAETTILYFPQIFVIILWEKRDFLILGAIFVANNVKIGFRNRLMSTRKNRILCSLFFFSIFFTKMTISALPICSADYDSKTIVSVIMQLEIENQNNGGDIVKDIFTKYYNASWSSSHIMAPIRYLAFTNYIPDDARDIRAYFPAVPTPPPNYC